MNWKLSGYYAKPPSCYEYFEYCVYPKLSSKFNSYDVWLVDWRVSCNLPLMAKREYTLDDCAKYDYPAAIDKILEITNKVQILFILNKLKSNIKGSTKITRLLWRTSLWVEWKCWSTIVRNYLQTMSKNKDQNEMAFHWELPYINLRFFIFFRTWPIARRNQLIVKPLACKYSRKSLVSLHIIILYVQPL